MSDVERESFERQEELAQQTKLEETIADAKSLGVDTNALIVQAAKDYKFIKGFLKDNRASRTLVDNDIRSELDYVVAVVRHAIQEKRESS